MIVHSNRKNLHLILLIICFALTACNGKSTDTSDKASSTTNSAVETKDVELLLSVAASLKDAMQEIEAKFEASHSNIKLSFNYGGSGALQQQIEQGAPVDIFLSAASKPMNALLDKGIVSSDQHHDLLANELVVIVPAEAALDSKIPMGSQSIADLANDSIHKIAIGIPESVPAGSYAKEAIEQAKQWDTLQSKLVQAKDVRQVLQYVETGNVDAGFVYKTDALSSTIVEIAFPVDPETYSPIIYPVGIITSTKHPEEAMELYNFLQSDEAMAIYQEHGFSVPVK